MLTLELKKILKSDIDLNLKIKIIGKELFGSESLTGSQLKSARRIVYISMIF